MAGHGRQSGKGRAKGTPNKNCKDLQAQAAALGIDPFKALLFITAGDWKSLGYETGEIMKPFKDGLYPVERITMDHRLKAASEAATYLHAKRKAIDVVQVPAPTKTGYEHLSDEELDEE